MPGVAIELRSESDKCAIARWQVSVAFDAYTLLNPPHLSRVLILPESNEPRVPSAVGARLGSTRSNWPTSNGRSHRQTPIFSAVNPSPHRPLLVSGRFANGYSAVSKARNLLNSSSLDAAVKPFRVRAT
jgi:hypothetical protein